MNTKILLYIFFHLIFYVKSNLQSRSVHFFILFLFFIIYFPVRLRQQQFNLYFKKVSISLTVQNKKDLFYLDFCYKHISIFEAIGIIYIILDSSPKVLCTISFTFFLLFNSQINSGLGPKVRRISNMKTSNSLGAPLNIFSKS